MLSSANFISAIKSAIRNGYTMVIGGDVSEPGYDSRYKAAVIPTFSDASGTNNPKYRRLMNSNRFKIFDCSE